MCEWVLPLLFLQFVPTDCRTTSNTRLFCCVFLGSEQSKQIVFAPSLEPTFVNVPQNNFVEPFVLNPGTWTVVIEAEGILLVRRRLTTYLCFNSRDTSHDETILMLEDIFDPPKRPLTRRDDHEMINGVLLCSAFRTTWSCCPAPTTRRPSCRSE